MTKVRVKVPQLKWREETMDVPEGRKMVLTDALRTQQEAISRKLLGRNEEVARKLDAAVAPSTGGSGKWVMLGVGSLIGAGVGLVLAPKKGKATRDMVGQKAGKYVRVATKQTGGSAKRLGSQVSSKAAAIRSRRSSDDAVDMEPETITARVQTELGEDKTLKSLPRINVNTEPGGVVYLRGPVPSETERQRAEKIARKQTGVTEVVNELVISESSSADAVQ